ncbi:hypothetical protein BV898_01935 [Hypsibius exemplaris]|uniref:MARVEL domain-containing protein n=1 Tax=Hypsibius exemplaris TaxID=2072580 RepID=A0A1W0XAG8_HYPEX|nr:hypothetical protein BV898_01935 [Hypsibius exemplaris]
MHPYRNLLSVEQDILSRRQITALQVITSLEVVFGSAIVGMEFTANLFSVSESDIFSTVLGIWAGFLTILTGVSAYTNSRISARLHPIHATLLAVSHIFSAAFAAVSTLGVFGLRCVMLRGGGGGGSFQSSIHNGTSSPLSAASPGELFTLPSVWTTATWLECVLIVLYVVNFMVLGFSFGLSAAVLQSVRQAKFCEASMPDADEPEMLFEATTTTTSATGSAPIFHVENKKEKTQVITDIEAAVDGFYRRLEEVPDDDGEI